MTTQSGSGFLQSANAQMALIAVVGIVVILLAWKYIF
jgi:hypothetical protein